MSTIILVVCRLLTNQSVYPVALLSDKTVASGVLSILILHYNMYYLIHFTKLLLKTQVSLTSFLHSEVNLIIHIIVQDQDGQNNKKIHVIIQSKHFCLLDF